MKKHGIRGLLEQYSSSYEMLKTIYPEHNWDVFKFLQIPRNFKKKILEHPSYQHQFINYLVKKFNINQTNDWYSVSAKELKKILTIDVQTAMKIVKIFYPDLSLKNLSFGNTLTKKPQYILKSLLQELFPNEKIIEEYKFNDLDNLQLDYYFPDLKLAFQYQVIIIFFSFFL